MMVAACTVSGNPKERHPFQTALRLRRCPSKTRMILQKNKTKQIRRRIRERTCRRHAEVVKLIVQLVLSRVVEDSHKAVRSRADYDDAGQSTKVLELPKGTKFELEFVPARASVSIWLAHPPWMSFLIRSRIHSATVSPLTRAAVVMHLMSSLLNLTGMICSLVPPSDNFGRPTFFGLGFGSRTVLLNNSDADCRWVRVRGAGR